MIKKHISYPKIAQFRNIVTSLNRQFEFVGLDDDGEAIYDYSVKKPVLTFKGTVKLHGTNSGVSFNKEHGLWSQSRENIITPENDNAGFAFFVESKKEIFLRFFEEIAEVSNIDTKIYTMSIFGEWAGKGIQKGMGISGIEKSLFIFGVKISNPEDENFNSYWIDSSNIKNNDNRIYNIEDFKNFSIDIEFNQPKLSQNKLVEITEFVEKECPVAKHFGIEGLGEGVVWSVEYKDTVHRFKVKGDKHSVSKVKKLASVDVEKLNSINEFVAYAVTENRFNQAIEKIFGKNELDVKKLGDFIRWVVNDIISEELDTMAENKLEPKDVNKYISNKTREMFFTKYNSDF